MKQISKFTIFLSSFVNHGFFFTLFFLFLILPLGLAYDPAVDDPKLEELGKSCKAVTSEYKDALKVKKNFIADEIKQTEESLVAENDKAIRQKLMDLLRNQRIQRDEVSDKIRVISAGQVVKLSNSVKKMSGTKDKVIAFLSHQ